MKVIFLDIDGVLNNFSSRNFGEQFSPKSCGFLNTVLAAVPDAKIVVSSSWRMHGLEYMRRVLEKNGIDKTRVIDITGNEPGYRGHQIQCWMDRNPGTTNMVILDDENDMGSLDNRLVKTSSYIGLNEERAKAAVEMLEKPMK